MKRLLVAGSLLAAGLMVSGCYFDVKVPLSYRANTFGDVRQAAGPNDPQVSGESCNQIYLGIVGLGDGGYEAAVQDALSRSGGRTLYDVKSDQSLYSILGLYVKRCTHVTGKVLR